MNKFLAILELCAFYIEYKNTKFTEINFRGRTKIFYVNAAKVPSLPLLKTTTKPAHFLVVKKKILVMWIDIQTNKIQKVSKPYI